MRLCIYIIWQTKRKYLCQGIFFCRPTCTTKCHFFISFLESATKCEFLHSTIMRSKSCIRSIKRIKWKFKKISMKWWSQILPFENRLDAKGGFYSERADAFVISPNKQTQLFSWARILISLFHSKWLKSCQIRTWSCSNAFFEHSEQLHVLIWHDLSHLEWKKNQNSSSGK